VTETTDQLIFCAEDTIEESIVKCNVSKMELDYKFGGQNLGSADCLASLDCRFVSLYCIFFCNAKKRADLERLGVNPPV